MADDEPLVDCASGCPSHKRVIQAIGRNRSWIVVLVWSVGLFTLLVGFTVAIANNAINKATGIETDFGQHQAAEEVRDKGIEGKLDEIHEDLEAVQTKQDDLQAVQTKQHKELLERILTNH